MDISLSFDTMIVTAQSLIQGLWPIFVIPLGFTFALGLIAWIYSKLEGTFKL